MTDLIHEHHDENEQPKPVEQVPANPKDRQKRVFTYIAILFTVAFILILWSSLMNHSNNQMVLSELKENAAALQTTADALQTTLAENNELTARVDALESQLEQAQEALTIAQDENGTLTTELEEANAQVTSLTEELEALKTELEALKADTGEEEDAQAQQG